jgi:hypothetical protein
MRIIYFVLLLFLLTACAGETIATATPTTTPNPGEIALQMIQQQMNAEATSQVVSLQLQATQQVIGATATANQIIVEQGQTQQARQDAIATADQGRRDAAATQARQDTIATAERQQVIDQQSTQQAIIAMQNTQSADATATFTSMTLTAIPPHATLTQMAINNDIVINNQNVEKATLDLQKAKDTNKISWQIPLLIALVMLGAGVLWVIRKSRWNAFVDDDGRVLGFGHDDKYINPRLLTGPVLDLKTGEVKESTPEQVRVTERAQIIEALAVMPEQTTKGAAEVFNKYFGEKQAAPYEIVDGDLLPPAGLLDAQALKSIENDWTEATSNE